MMRDKAVDRHVSPASTAARLGDHFDATRMASLALLFASPRAFIPATETHVVERYSDAGDFGVLKKSGRNDSIINSLETLYQDQASAIV